MWTSSNDPVRLHSQPGQTGLCQGHEVLLLNMTVIQRSCVEGKKKNIYNREQGKVTEVADAQCWENTFTLKMLLIFRLSGK